MKRLLCLTCNKKGLDKIGKNNRCIYCGSYFDENHNIIDDYNKIKEEKLCININSEFNGLGIA